MKSFAFLLIIIAGILVSFINLHEEKQKLKGCEAALDFSHFMRAQIENFRLPIGAIFEVYKAESDYRDIFTDCNEESLPRRLSELCGDNGYAEATLITALNSSFDEAVAGARFLCGHIEEIYKRKKNEFNSKKVIRMIVPTAASLLTGILFI